MDMTLAFILGVLIVGILLIVVISLSKRGAPTLDVDRYRSQWLGIESQLKREDTASYHLTVLNADKLLDKALKERGFRGETMGERMRSAKTTWSNANAAWGAHKLRNQIAHEHDVRVTYDDARRALSGFKQALKDLGAI
jgi:hypothetical protein